MLQISCTYARAAFKDLLGQANHFLITILIGLNGVKKGLIVRDEEFHTSWNPDSVERSAERSRMFALDLALVRSVDAFDAYMMRSRRSPCSIANDTFVRELDGTGQKISLRLDVFNKHLKALPAERLALLKLAIDWRNRRVHSLADERLEKPHKDCLLSNAATLKERYGGLDVPLLLANFEQGVAPTFKEAASIIRVVHEAVAHFDEELLATLHVETYLRDALRGMLSLSKSENSADALRHACQKTWGQQNKEAKIHRTLRMIGVHEKPPQQALPEKTPERRKPWRLLDAKPREVPHAFVEKLVAMTPKEAVEYLTN